MRRVAVTMGLLVLGAMATAGCQKKSAEPAKTGEAATGEATTAAASAPAAPIGPPHRKAGLWVQTMNAAGRAQTMKMCLDADTDSKMAIWGQAMKKDSPCATNVITPTPGGWSFKSECDMGAAGHIVSSGVATGDFNSKYVVKINSTTTGASFAQANGTHEMQLEASYAGACPPDMKGGDVTMEIPGMKGGMKMNIEEMAKMQAGKH